MARRATGTVKLDGIDEATAVVAALKNVPKEIKKAVNKQTRDVVTPIWRGEVAERTTSPMDRLVLGTGVRVASRADGFVLHGANSRKMRSGGLVTVESWYAWEFGAHRNTTTTYSRRSANGGRHQVTRHTKRQLPARHAKGRVLFPAVAEIFPRVASLWVQTSIFHLYQAFK